MDGPNSHNLSDGKRHLSFSVLCSLTLLAAWPGAVLHAQEAFDREYQAKAAFIHNCIRFIVGGRFRRAEGERPRNAEPNEVIRVGVVGRIPSRKGFADLHGKPVLDRRVEVRFFQGWDDGKDAQGKVPEQHPQMSEMRKCHILFLCPSEKPFLSRILPHLQKEGILLLGDTPGFLEAGGIVNLLMDGKKVRFEINLAAAGRAQLQIRSSLRRLAVRTIEHDSLERHGDEGKQPGSKSP